MRLSLPHFGRQSMSTAGKSSCSSSSALRTTLQTIFVHDVPMRS